MKLKVLGEDPLNAVPFPCGQCLPCRINRRRVWTLRLLLELRDFSTASFVTLTYAPEFLPKNGSLDRSAPTLFLKRLRKKVYPRKVRYYVAGEYGGQTGRPHYHLILFGIDPFADEHAIKACWTDAKTKKSLGLVHIGTCEHDSIQYVAGYVTKKLASKREDYEEMEIIPEFSNMSLKPAIGLSIIPSLARLTKAHPELFDDASYPTLLRVGGKKFPLGRTLSQKLRDALEIDHDSHIETFLQSMVKKQAEASLVGEDLYQYLIAEHEPQRRKLYARCKIFNRRSL